MHEMSVAESLVELIEEESRIQSFSCVRVVKVMLGALGCVEPAALRFCFDAIAQGTIAEGARLDLEMISGEGWCPGCAKRVALMERYDSCPACGQCQVHMTAGDELRLAELEVD